MRREDLRVVVEGAWVWDTVLDLDIVLDVGATLDFWWWGRVNQKLVSLWASC